MNAATNTMTMTNAVSAALIGDTSRQEHGNGARGGEPIARMKVSIGASSSRNTARRRDLRRRPVAQVEVWRLLPEEPEQVRRNQSAAAAPTGCPRRAAGASPSSSAPASARPRAITAPSRGKRQEVDCRRPARLQSPVANYATCAMSRPRASVTQFPRRKFALGLGSRTRLRLQVVLFRQQHSASTGPASFGAKQAAASGGCDNIRTTVASARKSAAR